MDFDVAALLAQLDELLEPDSDAADDHPDETPRSPPRDEPGVPFTNSEDETTDVSTAGEDLDSGSIDPDNAFMEPPWLRRRSCHPRRYNVEVVQVFVLAPQFLPVRLSVLILREDEQGASDGISEGPPAASYPVAAQWSFVPYGLTPPGWPSAGQFSSSTLPSSPVELPYLSNSVTNPSHAPIKLPQLPNYHGVTEAFSSQIQPVPDFGTLNSPFSDSRSDEQFKAVPKIIELPHSVDNPTSGQQHKISPCAYNAVNNQVPDEMLNRKQHEPIVTNEQQTSSSDSELLPNKNQLESNISKYSQQIQKGQPQLSKLEGRNFEPPVQFSCPIENNYLIPPIGNQGFQSANINPQTPSYSGIETTANNKTPLNSKMNSPKLTENINKNLNLAADVKPKISDNEVSKSFQKTTKILKSYTITKAGQLAMVRKQDSDTNKTNSQNPEQNQDVKNINAKDVKAPAEKLNGTEIKPEQKLDHNNVYKTYNENTKSQRSAQNKARSAQNAESVQSDKHPINNPPPSTSNCPPVSCLGAQQIDSKQFQSGSQSLPQHHPSQTPQSLPTANRPYFNNNPRPASMLYWPPMTPQNVPIRLPVQRPMGPQFYPYNRMPLPQSAQMQPGLIHPSNTPQMRMMQHQSIRMPYPPNVILPRNVCPVPESQQIKPDNSNVQFVPPGIQPIPPFLLQQQPVRMPRPYLPPPLLRPGVHQAYRPQAPQNNYYPPNMPQFRPIPVHLSSYPCTGLFPCPGGPSFFCPNNSAFPCPVNGSPLRFPPPQFRPHTKYQSTSQGPSQQNTNSTLKPAWKVQETNKCDQNQSQPLDNVENSTIPRKDPTEDDNRKPTNSKNIEKAEDTVTSPTRTESSNESDDDEFQCILVLNKSNTEIATEILMNRRNKKELTVDYVKIVKQELETEEYSKDKLDNVTKRKAKTTDRKVKGKPSGEMKESCGQSPSNSATVHSSIQESDSQETQPEYSTNTETEVSPYKYNNKRGRNYHVRSEGQT